MNLRFGKVEFDRVSYDRDADVLYLSVEGATPTHWEESPEGHVLRYDESGELCGLTLIDVRHYLEHDGKVDVTVPRQEHLDREDLGLALAH